MKHDFRPHGNVQREELESLGVEAVVLSSPAKLLCFISVYKGG